jgi:polycystin 2
VNIYAKLHICIYINFISVYLKGYQKVVDKLSVKREKIADIQKALATADVNQDSKLDFEEWRTELKS